ncbi:MAG: arsenate reductase [Pseudomonadota bacterium]|jgi:arsenate reductase
MNVTIYHNPRCSKSRQTLDLIQSRGIEPAVVEYLKAPPNETMLRSLIQALGIEPRALLRKGESAYKDLGLDDLSLSDDALIKAMLDHPVLIERPIVTHGDRAVIGRPPESVLSIL